MLEVVAVIFDCIIVVFVEMKVVLVNESVGFFILSIVLTWFINGYLP
jgi:hypothetical protein